MSTYSRNLRVIDISFWYQHSYRNILLEPLHSEHILMEYHINRIGHWSNQYSGHCCLLYTSIQDTVVKGLRLIPSNVNLAGAEIELLGINDKEYILKTAVDYIRDDYDFIVIDCPPSLNMLTVNAMTTADTVLVPIQCEYYALEGLSQLIHTINLVQERLNPNLQMEGVVFTMYDVRTKLSNQVVEKDVYKRQI